MLCITRQPFLNPQNNFSIKYKFSILFLLYYSSDFCLYQTHKNVYTPLTNLSTLLTRKKQRHKSLLEIFLFYLSCACTYTYIIHPYSAFFGLTASIFVRHCKDFVHACMHKRCKLLSSILSYHIFWFALALYSSLL